MKKLLITFMLMVFTTISIAQEVIATAGGNASGTDIELSWTIGEPVTATTYGSGFILTQGFHQGQPSIERFNHQISFDPGWNIMSVNVLPDNNNLIDIFQSLINNKILNKVMNETGATIEDWGVYGGWINGIGTLTSTEGYKVNVTAATTLSVEGSTFLFPFNISLKTGWNIISWTALNEQDGIEVFQALINTGKLNKVMDEAGNTIEDWGIYGGWINGIGNLQPGEGYKVNVTDDCILTINAIGTKSDKVVFTPLPSVYFSPVYKGNGNEHMNINLINLAESGITEGDEIGIFDGNLCVGSAVIDRNFIYSERIAIPVSANDEIEGKNGFSNGNTITSKLYRKGNEIPLNIIPTNHQSILFEKGISLFANIRADLNTQEGNFSNDIIVKCYPNPFSEVINIDINVANDEDISIEVLNQMGQIVKFVTTKQLFNAGFHKTEWNGRNENNTNVSHGIYHLRVSIGKSVFHQKIIFSGAK